MTLLISIDSVAMLHFLLFLKSLLLIRERERERERERGISMRFPTC